MQVWTTTTTILLVPDSRYLERKMSKCNYFPLSYSWKYFFSFPYYSENTFLRFFIPSIFRNTEEEKGKICEDFKIFSPSGDCERKVYTSTFHVARPVFQSFLKHFFIVDFTVVSRRNWN